MVVTARLWVPLSRGSFILLPSVSRGNESRRCGCLIQTCGMNEDPDRVHTFLMTVLQPTAWNCHEYLNVYFCVFYKNALMTLIQFFGDFGTRICVYFLRIDSQVRICLLNQCVYKSLMCSEPLDLFLHVVEHTLSTKMWAGWGRGSVCLHGCIPKSQNSCSCLLNEYISFHKKF